jgi:hypothetical protein
MSGKKFRHPHEALATLAPDQPDTQGNDLPLSGKTSSPFQLIGFGTPFERFEARMPGVDPVLEGGRRKP